MLGFMEKEKAGLMHDDLVDDVGKRALKAMRQVIPELFDDGNFDKAWSQGFGAKFKYAKSAVNLAGTGVGFPRGTRLNGTLAGWYGGEVEMGLESQAIKNW